MNNNIALGAKGEDKTLIEYEKMGYRLFCRNMHFGRMGEIDLILIRDEVPFFDSGLLYKGRVVFCEVKTRKSDRFGSPATAVNLKKIRKYRTIANWFLSKNPGLCDFLVRFDISEVIALESGELKVNIIEGAF